MASLRKRSAVPRTHMRQLSDFDSEVNLNSEWLNYKGAWLSTLVLVCILRLCFGVVPGLTPEAAWTLTNVIFNISSFVMFHWIIGTPFAFNQGACDALTLWEQIDNGVQFTPTKKFFTSLPIGLFLLSTHYTHYDFPTFVVNFASLAIVLIAKLPMMHRVRLFGINKLSN